ncbi:unnamed protein product [Rotaria sordida]|uniref:Uncharacterized protein n=1 Tax=Rotaria sordida TaxID=392033 RepID=A0A814EYB6_9BILA|nr:unnamed protein product [Rotaria sordida]
MMKILIIIILCNIISINSIDLNYLTQKCYICEKAACEYPTANDIKTCSDDQTEETSGKEFVNGALEGTNADNIYGKLAADLNSFGINEIGLNASVMPSWNSLTRWVCYISKDKHRGCLLMGKGFCSEDKSWLGKIIDIGKKLANIMKKAKDAARKMFKDINISGKLDDNQKFNITNWFAENYMSKLVNSSNEPQYQLDTCCEGHSCNFASMIQISISMFILSALILI